MIEPTVGRILWYYPTVHDGMAKVGDQPMMAHVVYVHGSRSINALIWDHLGYPHPRFQVEICQEGDSVPGKGGYCQWMPYQIGQAKKHEAAS